MHEQIERRATGLAEAPPADSNTLTGYVVVYDVPATIPIPKDKQRPGKHTKFTEIIRKGAFSKVGDAGQFDAFAMLEHDLARPLGRRSNGSLRLTDDAKGVKAEIDLPQTSYAQDAKALVLRGDIRGMSVGMLVQEDRWDFSTEVPTREILRGEIYDVTVCALPAYKEATVSLRTMEMAEASSDKCVVEAEAAAKAGRDRRLRILRLRHA